MKHYDFLDYGFDLYIGFVDGKPRFARPSIAEVSRDLALSAAFKRRTSIRKAYVFLQHDRLEDDPFKSPEVVPCPFLDEKIQNAL